MNPQDNTDNDNYEKCIICKTPTKYKISQPITMRFFYIEGCGQSCSQCYYNHIYSIGNNYTQMMIDLR